MVNYSLTNWSRLNACYSDFYTHFMLGSTLYYPGSVNLSILYGSACAGHLSLGIHEEIRRTEIKKLHLNGNVMNIKITSIAKQIGVSHWRYLKSLRKRWWKF